MLTLMIRAVRGWGMGLFTRSKRHTIGVVHSDFQRGGLRRWAAGALCGSALLLLAGCPQQTGNVAAKPAANATAPAIAPQVAPQQAAPAQTTAQAVDAAANAYKVQQLINQADATYRTGVDNYKAGRLDAARLNFDQAVDQMLTSGMDIKGDPQLSDEFDQLLNAINALEMDALKQGNGLSPQIEEAPLDEANDVTFPANPERLGGEAGDGVEDDAVGSFRWR